MDQALKYAPFVMLSKPVGMKEMLTAVRQTLSSAQSAARQAAAASLEKTSDDGTIQGVRRTQGETGDL